MESVPFLVETVSTPAFPTKLSFPFVPVKVWFPDDVEVKSRLVILLALTL